MGLSDRVSRIVRANLNANKSVDASNQSVTEVQKNLAKLRQAVADAITYQNRTQQLLDKAQNDVEACQQRAKLAAQRGNKDLAREILIDKASHIKTARAFKAQLNEQNLIVVRLQQQLSQWEEKFSELLEKTSLIEQINNSEPDELETHPRITTASPSQTNEGLETLFSYFNSGTETTTGKTTTNADPVVDEALEKLKIQLDQL